MFELIICSRDGTPLRRLDLARVEQSRQRIVLGRADDCDIRIASPSVSRHHAAIEPEDDQWVVRDLGSTHGVEVEGAKVPRAVIRDGLTVVMGPAVLRFQASTEAVARQIARELNEPAG
jgi:pSer/pThr/pTyr-binding forkhead associated (FHA) protein